MLQLEFFWLFFLLLFFEAAQAFLAHTTKPFPHSFDLLLLFIFVLSSSKPIFSFVELFLSFLSKFKTKSINSLEEDVKILLVLIFMLKIALMVCEVFAAKYALVLAHGTEHFIEKILLFNALIRFILDDIFQLIFEVALVIQAL